ncbi:MAG: ankyrin repeat domain-containing protein [Legionellaceae bacterium]|nr:ankyrin repeat domain-containing protein [Legionellaceae bacterium]
MANKSAEAVFTELGINPNTYNTKNLNAISKWCSDNISHDINYHEDTEESYNKYIALSKDFIDNFLANIPKNIEKEVDDFQKQNAIQYAAYHGYDVYLSSLSLSKQIWNKQDPKSLTPLHLAAIHGQVNTTRILLEKGSDPMKTNNNQQTPIFTALLIPAIHEDALITRKKRVFIILAASDPESLTHKDRSGDTIFHLIVKNGLMDILTPMLKENPSIATYSNNHCHFLIHTAILNNQLEIAKQLLNIDDVAEQTDAMLRTPLHYAARYSTRDMLNLCLGASKNPSPLDMENKTPLILAQEANNYETTKILQNINSKV